MSSKGSLGLQTVSTREEESNRSDAVSQQYIHNEEFFLSVGSKKKQYLFVEEVCHLSKQIMPNKNITNVPKFYTATD